MRLVSGVGACCVLHLPFTACRHDNRIACCVTDSATFSNPTMTAVQAAQIHSISLRIYYNPHYNNVNKEKDLQRINSWNKLIYITHAGISVVFKIGRVPK